MTSMTKLSIGTGSALILLGIVSYFATGQTSFTAFIPSGFGILILAMGILCRNEGLRMAAAHIAVVVALLGFLGGFGMAIPKLAKGAELKGSITAQLVMGAICLLYIIFAVRSFIAARKAQKGS